ncbi:hypothetical protein SDC9_59498 [bioreactor metagenome]|uniref:Uncharacterized protein n=1 Tax=bioreactor metagenome TaxID=1076179 RepID=A0A644XG57_9ZZZZ
MLKLIKKRGTEIILIAGTVENKKDIMNILLKGSAFDKLLVRTVSLRTNIVYEMDCTLNKEWFTDEEQETIIDKYASWALIKPTVFGLIKGSKLPGYMKIVLSPSVEATAKIHSNAAALFINIIFEGNKLNIITGYSEKSFSMGKDVEHSWDEYAAKFFKHNGIIIE